ncbi:MAG: hypothetical protein KatS3mg105_1198 [Gemmatales bacterium]|nr:MAG: hypothetical protein KatS3mg105_1198 [Gemmatales bacterium]
MRSLALGTLSATLISVCAFLGAQPKPDFVKVSLKLVDDRGEPLSGVIRVTMDGADKPLELAGLFDRLLGLRGQNAKGWYVVSAAGNVITLPPAKIHITALAGLETERVERLFDLRENAPTEIQIRLPFLFRPEERRLVAGNTHLHLRNMTRKKSDEYLRLIPAADRLKILFISYLERFQDDRTYITNEYPPGDLKQFDNTGVLVNNGEEYRHNFTGFGQGYGHVMFLNLKKHIKPASLGPGITKQGFDDTPLRPGIDAARKQGATIIWCHNTFGYEDVPNALASRLNAINVFDGSRRDQYEDTYYHYLNIGMRMPISTGTDWFLYDFARVYARVDGPVTIANWLDAVKAGKNLVTNGPLLTLTVNDQPIGSVLKLEKATKVHVKASALGRHEFGELQLVQNGKVVASAKSAKDGKAFRGHIAETIRVDEPCWFAARIANGKSRNELEQVLFAHTSPVYVDVGGKRVFLLESAQTLLKLVEQALADVRARGRFRSPEAREKVLAIYRDAIVDLQKRMNDRGK